MLIGRHALVYYVEQIFHRNVFHDIFAAEIVYYQQVTVDKRLYVAKLTVIKGGVIFPQSVVKGKRR